MRRLKRSRAVVDKLAAGEKPIYGLNTGLGAGVDTRLTAAEMNDFQARVLIARSVGIGPRFGTAEVRALLAARLVGLTQGAAGLSPALAERIAAMLNKGVHPVVPSVASVGESDLAPMLARAAAVDRRRQGGARRQDDERRRGDAPRRHQARCRWGRRTASRWSAPTRPRSAPARWCCTTRRWCCRRSARRWRSASKASAATSIRSIRASPRCARRRARRKRPPRC